MMRKTSWALSLLLLAASPGAALASPKHDAAVEAIIAQSLVERGAYLACADLAPDSMMTEENLTSGWHFDLQDTATELREAGYDEAYVETLVERSDLAKATPHFADHDQQVAFCGTLGAWEDRLDKLMNITPQTKVAELLRQRKAE